MARTRRTIPHWAHPGAVYLAGATAAEIARDRYVNGRDRHSNPVANPDDPSSEVWGTSLKRLAKARQSRLRRQDDRIALDDALVDADEQRADDTFAAIDAEIAQTEAELGPFFELNDLGADLGDDLDHLAEKDPYPDYEQRYYEDVFEREVGPYYDY